MRLRTPSLPLLAIAIGMLALVPSSLAAQEQEAREAGYRTAMQSDLRNLVVAQEMFFANNMDYARSMPKLGEHYRPSEGVTVVILTSSGTGWSGIAVHEGAPGVVCAMYVGSAGDPLGLGAAEGEPVCRDPEGKRAP